MISWVLDSIFCVRIRDIKVVNCLVVFCFIVSSVDGAIKAVLCFIYCGVIEWYGDNISVQYSLCFVPVACQVFQMAVSSEQGHFGTPTECLSVTFVRLVSAELYHIL